MLQDLSLHILDIAQNSIQAGASLLEIGIEIHTDTKRMRLTIADDGCGMSEEQLGCVTDPFFTSRTTRRVGLGVPFLKQSAECTGGTFSIKSKAGQGTVIRVEYRTDHIDCLPLGDLVSTIYSLVILNGTVNLVFAYEVDDRSFVFDTREIRGIVGDIPLGSGEVAAFIKDYLKENIMEADNGNVF